MSDLPSWTQTFVAIGGSSLLSGLLAWLTGHQMASANARKTNAEAARIEAETHNEALRVEASRVNFEETLNKRVTIVMESLGGQVKYLSELVETQSTKITEQSALIAQMDLEIKELRKALTSKTQDLHKLIAMLPDLDPSVLGNPA